MTDMVNDQGLSGAVAELHKQHPHRDIGKKAPEALQNSKAPKYHQPVSGGVYGSTEKGPMVD